MHIYNLGYRTYEESDYVQLYHKDRFDQREFEKIVAKAVTIVLKKRKILKDKSTTFQSILHDVAEELIKNFGFREVKFNAHFNVFGWADILDEGGWEHDRDEQLNVLAKAVKKGLKKGAHDWD